MISPTSLLISPDRILTTSLQETSFAQSQPVTRSLSSVGKKAVGQQSSSSRLPVLSKFCQPENFPVFIRSLIVGSNLARTNSNSNKNTNNKLSSSNHTESLGTNGNLSNVINNNQHRNTNNGNTAKNIKNSTTKLTNRNTKGNIEEISPWLVQDNVINNKKSDKSKIPMLKTVITTEL